MSRTSTLSVLLSTLALFAFAANGASTGNLVPATKVTVNPLTVKPVQPRNPQLFIGGTSIKIGALPEEERLAR
jgi:hypothetical protein